MSSISLPQLQAKLQATGLPASPTSVRVAINRGDLPRGTAAAHQRGAPLTFDEAEVDAAISAMVAQRNGLAQDIAGIAGFVL